MLHLILCISVWSLISLFLLWRTMKVGQQAINHVQRLHQIPCSKCAYFTGDYRLKCAVNPIDAMSEAAIDCRDFTAGADSRNSQKIPYVARLKQTKKKPNI
ncbi:hypothetical protein [Myxosarcina sp. GI1(2024)]